jgi:hypothetical protein
VYCPSDKEVDEDEAEEYEALIRQIREDKMKEEGA